MMTTRTICVKGRSLRHRLTRFSLKGQMQMHTFKDFPFNEMKVLIRQFSPKQHTLDDMARAYVCVCGFSFYVFPCVGGVWRGWTLCHHHNSFGYEIWWGSIQK